MKSFFSRLNGDIQTGSSKPTKESSYKFWIPSNTNAERSPPKPIPVHPDVAASHGEKRSRPFKSTHPPKIPLHDLPTAPLETQAIHTSNDMSRYTTKPNPGSSSTPYSHNPPPPPSSRTLRPHDTRYQEASREAHGPYSTGTHTFRETSSKPHHGGRHESAPVPREIWLPSTTPAVSKQAEDRSKLHVQGASERPEQYRESGDHRDRVKEFERRGKDRDRDRRERERERERERGGKGRTREREREEWEQERSRTKEREIAWAKREQDRNLEVDRRRDRDKYERDRREQERDSDREGKNRTHDRSRKESSNLTRGMERAWDSDVPYDGHRTTQDERKTRRRDRTTGGVGKDDNRESHKERDRWLEKESERARERLGGQIKHRAEATDGEQLAGRVKTPAPDRERRKDSGVGWLSDTHTGHNRKLLRKTPNTLLSQPSRAEEGDSSDSSTRPNRVQQVLTKRHRGEEGGSSSKINHSRQGMPAEPLTSTKSSAVKATIATISHDVQLPVPHTPQHMPIYLPPKESNAIDSGLPPTVATLNVVSARETEAPPRREMVNRLKSTELLPHAAENVSKPREVDTSIVRRPPSRGPAQPQNLIPSYSTIAPFVKGTRESVYSHRPKNSQLPPTFVHDTQTSTQAEGSKEPNRSQERLPESRPKKEVEMDLVPSVFYKVQHRIPPQSAGTEPSRQPAASTPQDITPLASTNLAPPNLDLELPRKVTHSLLQQGSNMQIPAETDASYNLQLCHQASAVMSGSSLAHEAHVRMGTPVAQVVLGKSEPMYPPSNTATQSLQSAPPNVDIIQDSSKQAVASSTVVVSKTNEVEATKPQNEVSLSSIKQPIEKSQLYTESVHRPSTAMGYKSSLGKDVAVRPHIIKPTLDTDSSKAYPLVPGWRNNVNDIPPNTLSNQVNIHVATPSSIAVDPKTSLSKSSQSRSNGQESIGRAITRPSTTTGFRQSTTGKNLRHHNISLSHSDIQNSIGISIARPSTATMIKQSDPGSSSRQMLNASHILNPLVEAHPNMFPGLPIPTPNPQPVMPPLTEKGSGSPAQPYNMTPSAGLSSGRGHSIVLPEDVTGQQDVSGSHKQGDTDGAADVNVISPPENFTSQALNPKPDNLRNALAVSIPISNDNLVKLHSHSASMLAHREDNRETNDHVPVLHQVSKENGVVPQRVRLASVNNDSTENSIIPTSLNANASNPQPITLPSTFTASQIQIQPPPTSHKLKENSVVPQRATLASVNNDSTRNNIIPTSLNAIASSAQPINLTAPHVQIQRPPTSHQVSKENSNIQRAMLASANNDGTGNNIISTTLNAQASSAQPVILPSSFSAPQVQIQRPSTSHQASKENSVVPQRTTLASVNNDSTENNIVPTSLNTKASSTQSTLPSSFTTPQIQIQRPHTSISTRNNSVPSAFPSAVIVPQIQIHHLITTTGTGNKPESPHTDLDADASIPRIPGVGVDMPHMKRLATATANVLPIPVDQQQDFLGSENKLHRPVHLVSTPTTNANDMRPSINEGALPLHKQDSPFNISRVGSSQDVRTQTVVNNHLATSSSHQPGPASSANQAQHVSVPNVILDTQINDDLVQGSPSLGFFNNMFSQVLHSPVMRRSGQGGYPAIKADGKVVSAVNQTGKNNATINVKTFDSLVNGNAVRDVLPKEQPEVPSVERLIAQKDLDIHNAKVAFSQMPSEVNRSSKFPSPPSQPRIQHPGLAEILSSSFEKNDQAASSHHQPTNSSTAFSKSGSSPKLQGSLDKQRPDDKVVPPKSSPSPQSPSDLYVEKHLHESPKRQLQQTPTTTSRSARLEHLLSDPHGGDSLGLTPSNVPSSSSHPSIVLRPPHTTSTVPDEIPPVSESIPHVNNKKPDQPGPYPEVPISSGGSSQVEELASRKIKPASIVDSKPLVNSIPHYRAATPLRESTSTRHQHSTSLPVHLVPSASVPSADGPLRSTAHPPLHHHPTSHTKSSHTRPPDLQRLTPNATHAASDSEETILMTPSSLARSVMLKPTVSRQSVTPSMSSQTARKGTGLFTMFRSKTPAQPPPQYEIWHPNTFSKTADPNVAPSDTISSTFMFPDQRKTSAATPVPVTSVPNATELPSQKSKIFTPFRYLTTKRNRAVSLVSVEAQDGTAPSTVVGSPTTSMLSQAPFQPPPIRDPMQATEEWRNKEDEIYPNGKLRRQRPGVVFDVAEERPEDGRRQRPKRTRTRHKSSSKPS